MKPTFVYSGTFDPPTFGHFSLLQEAAQNFDTIVVVPSDHCPYPAKFSQQERVDLWKTYPLPDGVIVETFDDFLQRNIPGEEIILIRGIRSQDDGQHEARVLLESAKNANITKSFTLVAKQEMAHISSSLVWEAIQSGNIHMLEKLVNIHVAKLVQQKNAEDIQ